MKGVVVVAAVATVALLVGASASSAVPSGLHGRVCRGPMPTTGRVTPCATPQRLVFLLVRPGSRHVVRSGADGSYRVTLSPGVYRAQLPVHVGIRLPRLRPSLVHVRAGVNDLLDFYFDTRTGTAVAQ